MIYLEHFFVVVGDKKYFKKNNNVNVFVLSCCSQCDCKYDEIPHRLHRATILKSLQVNHL